MHVEDRLMHGLLWDDMLDKASNGAPMKKCPGVKMDNSLLSFDKRISGRDWYMSQLSITWWKVIRMLWKSSNIILLAVVWLVLWTTHTISKVWILRRYEIPKILVLCTEVLDFILWEMGTVF